MNFNPSFVRKIVYLCAIAGLLFPLFILGQPASVRQSGERQQGGKLAELRVKYDLSQAELGEIDPAGESMKLATLGMRGVAAAVLWHKTNEYKMKEDWDKLSATLNQITKLQPNYTAVWENQAHNLSYNVSVEFDDYRHRYHWVKKGIDFLITGTRLHRREARLLWYTGWFFGQKVGRADEHMQFRRIFRTDHDFHAEIQPYVDIDHEARGPDNQPDNWLTGRLWFLRGQQLVDTEGVPIRGKSPLVFHGQVPMSRINYSVAIEDEGFLDEKAELAWRLAGNEFRAFGDRQIPTSWGENIQLNAYERVREDMARTTLDLDELLPGVRDEILKEKFASLSPEQREAQKIPFTERTAETYMPAIEAEQKLLIRPTEIANRSSAELRDKARRLARRIEELETTADRIHRYRDQVNYDYWKTRCSAEQKNEAVQARKHMFEGNRLKEDARLDEAEKEYELAWELWDKIFQEFPMLEEDRSDDLMAAINKYVEVLLAMDKKVPEDFKLKRVMEKQAERMGNAPPPTSTSSQPPTIPATSGTQLDPPKPVQPNKPTDAPKDDGASKGDEKKDSEKKPEEPEKKLDESGKLPEEKKPDEILNPPRNS